MAENLPTQLSDEWKALEKKAILGLSGHAEVADFLRRWTLRAAEQSSEIRTVLLSLVESARPTLIGQVETAEALWNRGRQSGSASPPPPPPPPYQSQRDHDEELRRARDRLRRTNEEIEEIQRETERENRRAREMRDRMNFASLFPEKCCPHCYRSYGDLTGGCWHCQHPHRPWHF